MRAPLLAALVVINLCCIPIYGENQSSWTGKYSQKNGVHELSIEQWAPDEITVEITDKNSIEKHPSSHFFALIKENTASFQEPGCRVELKRVQNALIVSDYCGSTAEDTGPYEQQD